MNKKPLTAVDHVVQQGSNSRTSKFNATMMVVTPVVLSVVSNVPEAPSLVTNTVPAVMAAITGLGNIWLYGDTHVKHSKERG